MAENLSSETGTFFWRRPFALLTFLDLFSKYGKTINFSLTEDAATAEGAAAGGHDELVFCLPTGDVSSLEARFLASALPLIQRELSARFQGATIEAQLSYLKIVRSSGAGAPQSRGRKRSRLPLEHVEIKLMVEKLEQLFSGAEGETLSSSLWSKQSKTYFDIVNTMAHASVDAIQLLIPECFPEGPPNLTVLTNVPMEESFMVPFDLCFETDPANSRISHPNFNLLRQEHHELYFRTAELKPFQKRKHFAYLCEAVSVLPHEAIHVYQGAAKQRDTSPGGWSAEFDASFPPFSLLHALATDMELARNSNSIKKAQEELLSDGIYEAVVLWSNSRVRSVASHLEPKQVLEYIKYRNSFGTYIPKDCSYDQDEGKAASLFKGLICRDFIYDRRELLVLQLQTLFNKDRHGVNCFKAEEGGLPKKDFLDHFFITQKEDEEEQEGQEKVVELRPIAPWFSRQPCLISEVGKVLEKLQV